LSDRRDGNVSNMVTMAAARRIALSLPEAAEAPHHDMTSFRINNKIFATVPDRTHLHVMVDEDETAMAVAECPSGCEELWWGKRLSGIRVDLTKIDRELLTELLTESWRRRAPKALLARLEK
jgi:hypothetical protein